MDEKIRGMWTCEVCGREFALMHEDRYTVREEKRGGLAAAFAYMPEPTMWDAFDCPYCGCQNRVLIRKREVEETSETVDKTEDICDGVKNYNLCDLCPLSSCCDKGENDE